MERVACAADHRTPVFAGASGLAIEDDPVLVRRWTRALANHDVKLTRAASVRAARSILEAWESAPFDFVLLDLRLPDGSGLDLFPRLLALNPAAPVAVVSGYLDSDVMLRLQSQSILAVTKPVTAAQLETVLDMLLDPPRGRWTNGDPIHAFCREHGFTQREIELFRHLVDGRSRNEAADLMGCCEGTVHTYVLRMCRRAGVHEFQGLLLLLLRKHVVLAGA